MYSNPRTIELVKGNYKTQDGSPFIMTPGQNEIHDIIFGRVYPRVHCMTYTQYGKSDTVSMGLLNRVVAYPEKWAIVAGSSKKAGIIMSYLIGHIFDNRYTLAKFVPEKGESIDYIRRHRAKDRLTFRVADDRLSEVFILSAEGKRTKDVLDAILGFGAPNIILDESSLLDDDQYIGVKRMLGGQKDSFIFEIGNAIRRNHFYRTSRDPNYYHMVVKWQQGVEEGRISEEFVEELRRDARKNPVLFGMLYDCEFPSEDAIDSDGYLPLITDTELDLMYVPAIQLFGELRLGVDVAGGGRNQSVLVLRGDNGAKCLYAEHNPDTMAFVGSILQVIDKFKIKSNNVFVDVVGIGKGAYDRLCEQFPNLKPVGVNFGVAPENNENFTNLRAQAFWRMSEWLKSGSRLEKHSGFEQLMDIRYTTQSDRKLKIKSKEDMIKRGIESPDIADALALTFATAKRPDKKPFRQSEWVPRTPYEGRT